MAKGKSRSGKTINCTFQLASEAKSPYWSVVKYYQSLEKEKARQLLLEAITGYWGAIALLRCERELSVLTKKSCLEEGIYQLGMQIDFLRCQFALDEHVECKSLKYLPFWSGEPALFDFRHQIAIETTEGLLVQFLMDSTTLISREQKVLWSSLSYWGAIAERELGILPSEQLTLSAANCIYRLERQIAYLKRLMTHLDAELNSLHTPPLIYPGWGAFRSWRGEVEAYTDNGVVKEIERKNGRVSSEPFLRESEENDDEQANFWQKNSGNDELILNAFNNL